MSSPSIQNSTAGDSEGIKNGTMPQRCTELGRSPERQDAPEQVQAGQEWCAQCKCLAQETWLSTLQSQAALQRLKRGLVCVFTRLNSLLPQQSVCDLPPTR
jgi:hypothetical protein